MTTNRAVLRQALRYVKALKRREAEYAAEVDAWYRSGPGRPSKWITEVSPDGEPYRVNVGGNGYRFPSCPHGMSLWTDYDNICGYCEDPISVYAQALSYAHSDIATVEKRQAYVLGDCFGELPDDLRRSLLDWAMEPITQDIY